MQLLMCTQLRTHAAYMSSRGKNVWSGEYDTFTSLDELLKWLEGTGSKCSVDISGDNVVILRFNAVGYVVEKSTLVCESPEDKAKLTDALLKLLPKAV